MNVPHFYRLTRTEPPWGDYGDILIHGMATRSKTGVLELERSGPYIPPITQPGRTVVVSAAFLKELQGSNLSGYEIGPVNKKRIPMIDWREWEPYGSKEMKYPTGGEPENYILRRKHSPEAADGLGEIWELRFQLGIQVSREGGYHLVGDTWKGSDFFQADGDYSNNHYVSEKARDWLLEKVPEWVAFEAERVR